jgi:hypothetical protein
LIRSKHQLLILLLILAECDFLPQTKIEYKDSSQNKITINDTTITSKLKNNNYIKNYFDSSLININPSVPLGLRKLSLKFSLIDNFEIWYMGFKNKRYFDEQNGKIYNSILKQQKEDLFNALKGTHKVESSELTFIRKYLGLSRDAAALVLLIIHLVKY